MGPGVPELSLEREGTLEEEALSTGWLQARLQLCLCLQANEISCDLREVWACLRGFSGGSDGKESTCNAGDPGSIPGLGRSPRGGHGNPLQYSCLENPMKRGTWWATVHGVANRWTRLSD